MVAMLGYSGQAVMTGVGPFQNLQDHLANPSAPVVPVCAMLSCVVADAVAEPSHGHASPCVSDKPDSCRVCC